MIKNLIRAVIIIFFILFPVFFQVVTAESYEYNKLALLIFTALVLIILTSLRIAREKIIHISQNSFTVPLFFLTGLAIVSTLFQSPNIMLTLVTPLSTATIVAGFFFYIMLLQNRDFLSPNIFGFLVIDACLLSLFVLLQQFGVFPNNLFTPGGTLFSTALFLSVITAYLLSQIILYLKPFDKLHFKIDFLALCVTPFLLIGGTTVFLITRLLTTSKAVILPMSVGWPIFVEVLKNFRTLSLGVGPANFLTAFSLTKPQIFNNTPYWNLIFTQSSSFLLNLGTELGILAVFLFIFILLKSLKLLKSLTTNHQPPTTNHQQPYLTTLIFTLVLLMFFPGNMNVFITAIILMAIIATSGTSSRLDFSKIDNLSYFLFIPVLIAVLFIGFFAGKIYYAETVFKSSLDALVNNRGEEVYNLQTSAISLNPYLDHYRVAFSQTNLALANAIAAKKEPTAEDKQNIPNLVRQSIDHARTAITLYRTNEMNWDNLARIYAGLIGYAEGARDWAVYSFQQKIILDPLNPNSYLSLAELEINEKNWAQVENLAQRAVNLKPDLANAHYFLSLSLQGQQKYKEAYTQLQNTYALLNPDSDDGKKVSGELETLEKLVPPEEATGSSDMKTPTGKTQTLDTNGATSSAIRGLPTPLPTISLSQTPP